MPDNAEISAEIAYGEALGASLLTGMLLKRLVQKGIFSDAEVADLIDQALLGMERLQEKPGVSTSTVARARAMLANLLQSFSRPRRNR
jgi:hypothetical protein